MQIKKIVAIALTVLSLQAAITPRQSQAAIAVGGFIGGIPLLGLFLIPGVPLAIIGGTISTHTNGNPYVLQFSIPVLLLGIIFLDEKSENPMVLTELSAEKASEIGLTRAERAAYNAEIDEINAIHQSVVKRTYDVRTGMIDDKQVHALWDRYCGSISDESCSALNKVARHAVEQVQKASAK